MLVEGIESIIHNHDNGKWAPATADAKQIFLNAFDNQHYVNQIQQQVNLKLQNRSPLNRGPRDPNFYEVNDNNNPEIVGGNISPIKIVNKIYYGPPGTGKTFELQKILQEKYSAAENKRYEFVTFHQSYGYEEFVEGLRPVIHNGAEEQAAGDVRYEIRPGAFLRLCEKAKNDPENRYAMVIDEINRGNISKIFGELITLIETDKREGQPNALSVTLPYSGKSFTVPSNVDVLGSMNTADRSLALVDTALRRRFEFEECIPNPQVLANINIQDINLCQLLTTMNARIEALYDRDHTVGHAYFTALEEIAIEEKFIALQSIFKNKIIPLLEEYFFEDWQKIQLVLGDNQKPRNIQFIQETGDVENSLTGLFGAKYADYGLDEYAIRRRYQINEAAFKDPSAYIRIYAQNFVNPAQP